MMKDLSTTQDQENKSTTTTIATATAQELPGHSEIQADVDLEKSLHGDIETKVDEKNEVKSGEHSNQKLMNVCPENIKGKAKEMKVDAKVSTSEKSSNGDIETKVDEKDEAKLDERDNQKPKNECSEIIKDKAKQMKLDATVSSMEKSLLGDIETKVDEKDEVKLDERYNQKLKNECPETINDKVKEMKLDEKASFSEKSKHGDIEMKQVETDPSVEIATKNAEESTCTENEAPALEVPSYFGGMNLVLASNNERYVRPGAFQMRASFYPNPNNRNNLGNQNNPNNPGNPNNPNNEEGDIERAEFNEDSNQDRGQPATAQNINEAAPSEHKNLPVADLVADDPDDSGMTVATEFSQIFGTKKERNVGRNIRFVKFGSCVLLTIGVIILVALTVTKRASNGILIETTVPPTMTPTTFRENLGITEVIEGLILSDRLQSSESAETKALNWILNDDPLELLPSSTNLFQRYLMAYFYYHTSQEEPWYSCSEPKGKQRDTCTFQSFFGVRNEEYRKTRASRWLSGTNECQWAGVTCQSGKITNITLLGQKLSGTFPSEIVKMSDLRSLDISHNQLTGSIPSSIWKMKSLRFFKIHNNFFTGTMPREWVRVEKIKRFELYGNMITGTIPTEFAQISSLNSLLLADNELSGTLPTEIFGLSKLHQLTVHNNKMVGTIPTEIGLLSHPLRNLWLSGNKFNGTLPTEMGKLQNLQYLHIKNTKLSGTLPEEIWEFNMNFFWKINLESNNFTGTLSTKIGRLRNLDLFKIANNALTGTIPTELGNIKGLRFVTFQNNYFSGNVPAEMCASQLMLLHFVADCNPSERTGLPAMACPVGCCTVCCDRESGVCSDT